MPTYCSFSGKNIFCYISRSCPWEVLYKLFVRGATFLLKLQAVRIIKGFPAFLENGLFFMKNFADIF